MEKRNDQIWILTSENSLEPAKADEFLRHPNVGGVSIFVGTTREWTGDVRTVELSYEAYEAMALTEMERLISLAGAQWPIQRACIFHRLGTVGVKEASVVVGVSTPHRADAFAACRFLIDSLKVDVPIWKKEKYSSGDAAWVGDPLPNES